MKKTILFIVCTYFSLHTYSQCSSTQENDAVYNITFQSTWNTLEHTSIPNGAHWSDLLLISHNTPNAYLEIGLNASTGIKNMAELGDNTALKSDATVAINTGSSYFYLEDNFSPNNATSSLTFTAATFCEAFPYVTLVSMIAPSPDWFIAVNSLDLREMDSNTGLYSWKEDFTIDVFAYDAGTDNGTDYDSPDSPNTPVAISMINGAPFNGNKIGTLTFDFQFLLLNTPEFNVNNKVKISPNPATDNITISSANTINTIQIYNILGSIVKDVVVERQSSININIADLSKGIYLVKTKNTNGGINTKKLIIK